MKRKIILLGPSAPYRGGIVHFNSKLGSELLAREDAETNLYFWKRLYPTIVLPKSEKEFQDHNSKTQFENRGQVILDYMNPLTWMKMALEVKKQDADIFLTHWTQPIHFPVFWILFSFIKLFSQSKIYVISHNVKQHEESPLNKIMTKEIFRLADKIIVHAKMEAEEAAHLTKREKIITAFHPLYNIFPVDDNFDINKYKRDNGLKDKVILFFGFIRPYKGLEYLINAFSKIVEEHKDVSLLIVGELFWKVNDDKQTSLLEKIKRLPFKMLKKFTLKDNVEKYNPLDLIKTLGLEETCMVVDNYVPNDDVFKYYKSADLFVAPYISASQSGPVQIAYAFDLPVVVSNVGGLKDIVEEGVSGYLSVKQDSEDIAKKILLAIENKNLTANNIREYKKRFYWSEYIKLILEE